MESISFITFKQEPKISKENYISSDSFIIDFNDDNFKYGYTFNWDKQYGEIFKNFTFTINSSTEWKQYNDGTFQNDNFHKIVFLPKDSIYDLKIYDKESNLIGGKNDKIDKYTLIIAPYYYKIVIKSDKPFLTHMPKVTCDIKKILNSFKYQNIIDKNPNIDFKVEDYRFHLEIMKKRIETMEKTAKLFEENKSDPVTESIKNHDDKTVIVICKNYYEHPSPDTLEDIDLVIYNNLVKTGYSIRMINDTYTYYVLKDTSGINYDFEIFYADFNRKTAGRQINTTVIDEDDEDGRELEVIETYDVTLFLVTNE